MSDMVERVARAIHGSLAGDTHSGCGWDFGSGAYNLDNVQKDRFRKMSRAAIEEMREPTDRMKSAAENPGDIDGSGSISDLQAEMIWQIMVDEALK